MEINPDIINHLEMSESINNTFNARNIYPE